jgi:alkylation response protein AidB-like acyl-CoA dehydrogenase
LDDRELLRAALTDLLRRHWDDAALAAAWAGSDTVYDDVRRALDDAGVFALCAPLASGGMAQTNADLCSFFEELGRFAAPDFIAAHVLGAVPTAAACEFDLPGGLAALQFGDASVAHGAALTTLLRFDGDRLEALSELRWQALSSIDRARPLSRLTAAANRRLIAAGSEAELLHQEAFDRMVLADCLQLLGLGSALIERASAYVRERRQFGKPVGAQQAVKHQLADALIGLEFARPLLHRAASALDAAEPCATGRISGAWLRCCAAAQGIERAALQVHGAIGYSFEYPLHRFLKRSWALRRAHGPAALHRARASAWVQEGMDHG